MHCRLITARAVGVRRKIEHGEERTTIRLSTCLAQRKGGRFILSYSREIQNSHNQHLRPMSGG